MKVEVRIFGSVGVFFLVMAPTYWWLSKDPVGTTALAMAFGLNALIWFYLFFTALRIGPRPEDRDDADISEMAGDIGFFSPYSWWPLFAAGSAALAVLGVVFGWWLLIIALPFLAYSIIGMVFEYYRRENDRYGEPADGRLANPH
jgi:cytochrome c oxidase subunit IV